MEYIPWEAIVSALVAFVLLVAWFIRLESKVMVAAKEIEELTIDLKDVKSRTDGLTSEIVKDLTDIKVSLAKLEGALRVKQQ